MPKHKNIRPTWKTNRKLNGKKWRFIKTTRTKSQADSTVKTSRDKISLRRVVTSKITKESPFNPTRRGRYAVFGREKGR